jgi:transposase InsO family protein
MEDRVTIVKISKALAISRQAARDRAIRESWPFEEQPCQGGKRRLYPLFSLPADVRAALGRVAASEAAAAGRLDGLRLKLETDASKATADAARQEGLAKFTRMGGAARARAEARASLLAAFDEFQRATGLPPSTARHVFAVQYRDGVLQIDADVRALLPKVCATSLFNWQKAIAEKGMARLAGDYGHREGSGKIDSAPEVVEYIKGLLYETPGISGTDVLEGLDVRFAGRGITLVMVQRWLKKFRKNNPRLVLDITSPDTCRSKYQPATGSRYEGIERPNQRWEMDSTKGDIMLWDGKTKSRHIIVACIDVYTRRVRFLVSRSSNSAAVASCLRRCLLDWGQVETLGTDNGSDFVSKHIVRIALALGIKRDVAPPFTPEHKPFVERVFGTFLHSLFESLPGYTGHNVAERKALEDRKAFAERLSKGLYKGELAERPELLLSPDALQEFCDEWADSYYAHKPHSGEGMAGKTPWEKAAEWSQSLPKIRDVRALDVLLSPVPGKKGDGYRDVVKKGLEIGGYHYTAPELGGHEGRRVLCLEDAADWGAVHVFLPHDQQDEDGGLEYLCRAVCPLLTGISRREAALARSRVYKKVKAEEKAAMRAASRKVGAKDVYREVMEHAVEQANKLSRLPQPTTPHETPMLTEAGIAARAGDAPTPKPATAADLAARAALAEDMAKQKAAVTKLRNDLTPRQKYARWLEVDAAIQVGAAVTDQDRKWWSSYQQTHEFPGQAMLWEMSQKMNAKAQ